MMLLSTLVLLSPVVLAVSSSPIAGPRATALDTSNHCGQWDSVPAGSYSLLLDLWGENGATSGSQCSHLISFSGATVSWATTWTWAGGSGVKSYSNIQLNSGLNKQLSAISSMPSLWHWSQTSSGSIIADVAYDLFTSATSGGSNAHEIMIWLANFGAGPISYNYSTSGQAIPILTGISLGGYTWNLYNGSNGSNLVWSFLLASGGTAPSFSADLNVFLKYLTSKGHIATSQYLITAQAGTEATIGSATLTTSAYTLVIN